MANYLTYPFKEMHITQNYYGRTSHYPHTTGNIKDYPIDEAGTDAGRDPFYCPCDEVIVKKIYGVGTRGTNTLWLESTSKCLLANGQQAYVTFMLIHPNDSDLRRLYIGQKFKRGQVVCYEGADGATGNHIHLSIGMGFMAEGGWSQSSSGKWVLRTTQGTIKPEQGFYVDTKFTKVYSANGIAFKALPTNTDEIESKYKVGDYEVVAKKTYLRKGPGKSYGKVSFEELTANAQKQVKAKNKGKEAPGYVKGVQFSTSHTIYNKKDKLNWGKTPSGWVCLERCKKI